MARPDTNHEEKKALIIEAALKTFAHYGYEGTTNKLVAEEVKRESGQNFSPALIYHYFPVGKIQLFTAVMGKFEPVQILGQAIADNSNEPPEIFLRRVAEAYIKLFGEPQAVDLMRIAINEGPRYPEVIQNVMGQIGPVFAFPFIAYFGKQIEQGRVKPMPFLNLVLGFFAPLLIRRLVSSAIGQFIPFPVPSDEEFIESHVQTFLHGLLIEQEAKSEN